MPQIIPIKDLKNTSEISDMCKKTKEPIYITKNGYGDMVIMSMDTYEETMSCDSKDREFSVVIDINENYESYKESAKSNNDEFKNKFVLFYTTWNDAGFYTLLVVRNFYENPAGKILGTIRICHDDLSKDNEEHLMIRHFLENDHKQEVKIDKSNKLSDKYTSIADSFLYDNLKKELGKDESVNEFLSNLNEISTITDNDRIKKIKDKSWYKVSFIRDNINKVIIDFTEYKNDIGIKENTYYVLKNLSEFSDKIMEVSKENSTKKRKMVLSRVKEEYKFYPEIIEEIDEILKMHEGFHRFISQIKEKLRIDKNKLDTLNIGHYTSLEVLKILITKIDNKEERPCLRLTNGRQMNDPLEGKMLLDYILNENGNLSEKTHSNNWKPTFWYMSSATTALDSLPMWKQYGKDATGGMLVYNRDYLKNIIEKTEVEIYKVAYINIVDDKIKVLRTENIENDVATELEKIIEELRNEIKSIREKDEQEINKYYMPLLSNIGILFKKIDYAYESEYRIVVNRERSEDKIVEQVNPSLTFPFLYTYLDEVELKYSKLILGPKAVDIDYIAPYIHYCDKSITIERSSISYR